MNYNIKKGYFMNYFDGEKNIEVNILDPDIETHANNFRARSEKYNQVKYDFDFTNNIIQLKKELESKGVKYEK